MTPAQAADLIIAEATSDRDKRTLAYYRAEIEKIVGMAIEQERARTDELEERLEIADRLRAENE